ncbi:MAG: serine/threonine-protein kinase [Byssovorax sp.]
MSSHYIPATLSAAFSRFVGFRLIGQGGEGAVFSVWDLIRKADLALKLMRDSGEADLGERFEHEYGILASARSPRLVTVYEHGMAGVALGGEEVPHYWYTMEQCERSVRAVFSSMPLRWRVDAALQMVDALALLHAMGVAHRDIKPDNLFVVRGNQIKLGDFGLAKVKQSAGGCGSGMEVSRGSPPYLAPERWSGLVTADWRPSDQYAAGVTIFELLSAGGAPLDFGATRESCYRAHWQGKVLPLWIPELGRASLPAVDSVLGRMLGKRPEWRYPDLAECKRELTAALAQDGV